MRQQNFVIYEPMFTNFLVFDVRCEIDCGSERHFPFIDIFICSQDMCNQSLKLFENVHTINFE